MKLVLYDDYRVGLLLGESVVDVSSVAERLAHEPGTRMNRLIGKFDEFRQTLEE